MPHCSIEGVDIIVPAYRFSETHYLPDDMIDDDYRGLLAYLTGKVNSSYFRGLQAGECLFLGAAGTKRGTADWAWEITFAFAGSPNVADIRIGDISGISKMGWEYLWVRYEDSLDDAAKALGKKPVAAYVEKVYEDGDFNLLGI